ncbi:MAG: ATP-binding protein [Actinobacteria bacterium]|nr:ATP-binding protein [Actinomycetota bacterium]
MDLRIGIAHMQKEVNLEMADDFDLSAFKSNLEEVSKNETSIVWLTDINGREVGIPGNKIGYVEIGIQDSGRTVGFS